MSVSCVSVQTAVSAFKIDTLEPITHVLGASAEYFLQKSHVVDVEGNENLIRIKQSNRKTDSVFI